MSVISNEASQTTENTAAESSSGVAKRAPVGKGRFRKGRSGNPKGRPAGAQNIATILPKILSEKITVSINGQSRRISKAEALVQLKLNQAIKGDPHATNHIISLAEKTGRLSRTQEGPPRGVLVVPGIAKNREEWERVHGAAARGELFYDKEGRPKQPAVTVPFTREQGDELVRLGRLDEALACYQRNYSSCKTAAERDKGNEKAQEEFGRAVLAIGNMAYYLNQEGKFKQALECAQQAIPWLTIHPQTPGVIHTLRRMRLYRADALMFLGHTQEAKDFYLSYRGQKFLYGPPKRMRSWESYLLRHFDRLREVGPVHPIMDEIERIFADGRC